MEWSDITAPSEDDERLTDPKDILIRNLRRKVAHLERALERMRTQESWRKNPDRMGS
jgi:hypothetical protein